MQFKQLMLKLDPDDADSDEDAREKLKLNTNVKVDTSPTSSILPSTGPAPSLNEMGNTIDNLSLTNNNITSHSLIKVNYDLFIYSLNTGQSPNLNLYFIKYKILFFVILFSFFFGYKPHCNFIPKYFNRVAQI